MIFSDISQLFPFLTSRGEGGTCSILGKCLLLTLCPWQSCHAQGFGTGSDGFAWIRIGFSNFNGTRSGSGFKVLQIRFQPPDPGAKKKSAERALRVIYQKNP